MACILCFAVIDDLAFAVKAGNGCKYKHKFYTSCAKIKYNFTSATEAASSIKNECPVCAENNVTDVLLSLQSQLTKLSKLDILDGL